MPEQLFRQSSFMIMGCRLRTPRDCCVVKGQEVGKNSFTVLSPTDNDGFRKREVDPYDEESIALALCIGSDHYYMTRTNGKRLKLTSPSTLFEEARSGWLNAAISASQQ
jgi:hypothetical protein